jgi:2-polyprenyl-3-methyl-5-hydroxy-6-metoxy-1,4-benzoquinol methylase
MSVEGVSVTRNEVIYAYRFLLGRDPENEAVIRDHLKHPNWMELRKRFLDSAEFKARHALKDFTFIPAHNVDISISDEAFCKLMKHIRASWETLGREKPHWSVLTQTEYLPQNIECNIKRFFETGEGEITVLNQAVFRANRKLPKDGACVELGCGVGRVTFALARQFRRVTGIDVSYPHLSLAESYKKNNENRNSSFVLMESLKNLETLPTFDFFYSTIVLQHNPPPLIDRMLRIVFKKIDEGGMAYFQIPVARDGYSFSIDAYLNSIDVRKTIEMHIFPQVHLFKLLEDCGLRLLDIQRDNATGRDFHSLTMLVEKCTRT